jgi:hypothetical protein
MKKVSSIVNGLKFVLKYTVYIMAIIKIIEFAISTLDGLDETKSIKTDTADV